MVDTQGLMACVCGHDEKLHDAPSPYTCTETCPCRHFRWTYLDWDSSHLRKLHDEKLSDEFMPSAWMPEVKAN